MEAELREIDKGIISTAVAKIKKLSEQLSEQQKPATVTIGRTRGETAMWYECDACGEPVDLNDNYCRNCGRKLIHD
jgi:predicted amidophosphoribosyltransferase